MKIAITISMCILSLVMSAQTWYELNQVENSFIVANDSIGFYYKNEPLWSSNGTKYTFFKSTDHFNSFTNIYESWGSFGCCHIDKFSLINKDTLFCFEISQGCPYPYYSINGGYNWEGGSGNYFLQQVFYFGPELLFNTMYNPVDSTSQFLINLNSIYSTTDYYFGSDDYHGINFINQSVGYIYCTDSIDNGVILKTTDQGSNWNESYFIEEKKFRGVKIINESIGFAYGTSGTLIRTTDSGSSWQEIGLPTDLGIKAFDMNESGLGYLSISNSELFKSEDFGLTWILVESPSTQPFRLIKVTKIGQVIVQDENGIIFSNMTLNNINSYKNSSIIISPNPTTDYITISGVTNNKFTVIQIFDIKGKLLHESNRTKNDVRNLKQGIYFILIETADGFYREKFVKL